MSSASSEQQLEQQLAQKIAALEASCLSASASQELKERSKARKKELRDTLKFLGDKVHHSAEDRVEHVSAKCSSMVSELFRIEKGFFESQAQLDTTTRERDRVQAELKRSNLMLSKLQDLCRQLQLDNKRVLEEAHKVKAEDLEARQALQVNFSASINDVTAKMEVDQAQRQAQQSENDTLRARLSEVQDSFDVFNKLLHQKDLEIQLANARLAQQEAINEQLVKKNEIFEKSTEQMRSAHEGIAVELETLIATKRENAILLQTKQALQEQLKEYSTKFSSLQTSMTKSNKLFASYKRNVEQSAKDAEEWKAKWFQERTAAVEKAELYEKQLALSSVDPAEVARLYARLAALESLCRTLQAQVKKQGGGEQAPPLPPPPQQQPQQPQQQVPCVLHSPSKGVDSTAGEGVVVHSVLHPPGEGQQQ